MVGKTRPISEVAEPAAVHSTQYSSPVGSSVVEHRARLSVPPQGKMPENIEVDDDATDVEDAEVAACTEFCQRCVLLPSSSVCLAARPSSTRVSCKEVPLSSWMEWQSVGAGQ